VGWGSGMSHFEPPTGRASIFPLASLLGEHFTVPRLTVVDAGAMDAGELPVYQALVHEGLADVVGFEPVTEECDKLNKRASANVAPDDPMTQGQQRFLAVALGGGERGEFRQCSQAMTSSMLEPNLALLSQFHLLEEVTTVVARCEMATKRLDDLLPELPGGRVDFIKLDVQGYELAVLQGAEDALRGAVAVHTEVEFVEMYKGQPLFADVDAHLRARGFVFHRFFGVKGAPARPMTLPLAEPPYSQQLWADAVYVRALWSPGSLASLSSVQLLRMALVLHEIYLSYDAAHGVLSVLDTMVASRYRDMVFGRASPSTSSWAAAGNSRPRAVASVVTGASEGERRVDPSDGRSYSFAELRARYTPEFSESDLAGYWRDAMRPHVSDVAAGAAARVWDTVD